MDVTGVSVELEDDSSVLVEELGCSMVLGGVDVLVVVR
jgi:hypothetical protein